jgi:hypothetical protein
MLNLDDFDTPWVMAVSCLLGGGLGIVKENGLWGGISTVVTFVLSDAIDDFMNETFGEFPI